MSREEVVTFYAQYDRRKKTQLAPSDLPSWPWDDPAGLDAKLGQNGLKPGVLAAYKAWWLVDLSLADLLECAIVNHIFKGQPQSLSLLVLRGAIETWQPKGKPEWHEPLQRGDAFPHEWAIIIRPSVKSEHPAKWYVEDGAGRVLSLLQRMLGNAECWRVAYGYLGIIPDERSTFVRSRPDLAGLCGRPAL